jgi:hypothetical protein
MLNNSWNILRIYLDLPLFNAAFDLIVTRYAPSC